MLWFKHDSDAHRDAKMRKLLRKHGLEAVGLYWVIIEQIVADLEGDHFTFELEADSEMLAEDTGLPRERVEAYMRTMVDLGLFEQSNGVITCMKILRRMSANQVTNAQLRSKITEAKARLSAEDRDAVTMRRDAVTTEPRCVVLDKTRQDKTRQDLANQEESLTTREYANPFGPPQ